MIGQAWKSDILQLPPLMSSETDEEYEGEKLPSQALSGLKAKSLQRLIMATRTLDHEILGQIRGVVDEDERTVQYRGIKFAEIPGRWQDPVLLSAPLCENEEPFDATKYGPACPQNPNGFPFDLSLIGYVSLEPETVGQSELQCLNLVVTVPAGLKKVEGLPVMVWYVP